MDVADLKQIELIKTWHGRANKKRLKLEIKYQRKNYKNALKLQHDLCYLSLEKYPTAELIR